MAFEPKDWENLPSKETPLTAEALIDLETRVTDYADDVTVDARVMREAPLNIEYPEYASLVDGDDWLPAIQAAANAARTYEDAGCGQVLIPNRGYPNAYEISDTIDCPQSVSLIGLHEDASVIRASSSFPATHPMVNLAGADTSIETPFGARIEKLQLDAADQAQTCLYSPAINEHGGASRVRLVNMLKHGILIEDTADQTPQNFALENIDIIYSTGTLSANPIGIRLVSTLATLALWGIRDISIIGKSGSNLDAGIRMEQVGAFASGIHVENATVGVDLGTASVSAGFGPVIAWVTGGPGVTTVARIRAGHAGNNATLMGLVNISGVTNLLIDDVTSRTVPVSGENQLGLYVLGAYTANGQSTVISSSSSVPTISNGMVVRHKDAALAVNGELFLDTADFKLKFKDLGGSVTALY